MRAINIWCNQPFVPLYETTEGECKGFVLKMEGINMRTKEEIIEKKREIESRYDGCPIFSAEDDERIKDAKIKTLEWCLEIEDEMGYDI